jgi:phosphopantothenoylcysteine decarboxylase/phosphopantothenate--cysteine ligase
MRVVVTSGPTYEPLDQVRRLTNFSSGRLGTELANYLTGQGHQVVLLLGQQATWHGEKRAAEIQLFTTTSDLRERLRSLSESGVDAVFHAAAVSDFAFGKVWLRSPAGDLTEARSGKLSTREGVFLAELIPTPKIIAELRDYYPKARLIGWKYEVDGDRAGAIRLGEKQIRECRTDACVVNGPAYGRGFGVLASGECQHARGSEELFERLGGLLRERQTGRET